MVVRLAWSERMKINKYVFLFLLIYGLEFGEPVKVMNCEMNGRSGTYAGAWWRGVQFEPLRPFTACVRFQFSKLKLHNVIVHINDTGTRPAFQMSVYVDKLKIAAAHEYKFALLEEWLQPYRWYYMCVAHRKEGGVAIYLNAKLVARHFLRLLKPSVGNFASIGFFDPHFYPGLSFVGNLTQFNVWNRDLSLQEIKDSFNCALDAEGDTISWKSSPETQNVHMFEEPLENLCKRNLEAQTKLLQAADFYESSFVCEAIGGELITPTNLSQGQELITWARKHYPKCNIYWIGIWDDLVDGVWMYHKTKLPVSVLPWAPDEPNGLHFENCGGLDFEGIIDDNCNTHRCPFCSIPPAAQWTLYGSCELMAHDMHYSLEIDERSNWKFKGYGSLVIQRESDQWIWRNEEANVTVATLAPSLYNFPMGRKVWAVNGSICHQKTGFRTLLLSTCNNDEFSCNDATCIAAEFRCDLKYDCGDNSDEQNCTMIRLPRDYKATVSPRGQHGLNGSSLPITIIVTIETIRIDTSRMVLEVSFNLTLSWFENRAVYMNLKKDQTLNLIDTQRNSLWSPSISFVNTEGDEGTVVDGQTSSFVVFGPPSHLTDLSIPERVTLFEGKENKIVSHRKYQKSFSCDFDLSRYPFDSQSCYLDLRLRYGTLEALYFDTLSSSASYKGNNFLMEYLIGDVRLSAYQTSGYGGVKILVPLKRLHGYAFINIYLPTVTMLIIGYLTLVFQITIFEVRIMTSLTSLLVLATLFTQVASSLPKTSYFKLIDIWFLFCIFFCFFVIVFHIVINALNPSRVEDVSKGATLFIRRRVKHTIFRGLRPLGLRYAAKDVQKYGAAVMLIIFVVFNTAYWSVIYQHFD